MSPCKGKYSRPRALAFSRTAINRSPDRSYNLVGSGSCSFLGSKFRGSVSREGRLFETLANKIELETIAAETTRLNIINMTNVIRLKRCEKLF